MANGYVRALGFIMAAAIGALAIPGPALADNIRLRIGAGHPVQGIAHVTAVEEFFIPEVTKRAEKAGHKIEWTKAWGGSVAKLSETLEATRSGILDIGVVNFPFHSAHLFTNNFPFHFPFQPSDHVLAVKAVRMTYEEVPWLKEVFERKFGQKHLGIGQNGDYGIGSKTPIASFDDLKGKKFGAAGPNLNWFRDTGIVGVQQSLNEAYNAIQTGVYHGYVVFPGSYYGFKLHEVGAYYLRAGLGAPAAIALTINLNTWKRLPKAVQDILVEVGREYDIVNAEMQAKADAEGLERLRAAGVEIRELSPAERAKWAEAVKGLPNEMAQDANRRGEPGTQVFRAYIANLKKLGYTFPVEYQID